MDVELMRTVLPLAGVASSWWRCSPGALVLRDAGSAHPGSTVVGPAAVNEASCHGGGGPGADQSVAWEPGTGPAPPALTAAATMPGDRGALLLE